MSMVSGLEELVSTMLRSKSRPRLLCHEVIGCRQGELVGDRRRGARGRERATKDSGGGRSYRRNRQLRLYMLQTSRRPTLYADIVSLERVPETGRLRFLDVNESQEREVSLPSHLSGSPPVLYFSKPSTHHCSSAYKPKCKLCQSTLQSSSLPPILQPSVCVPSPLA
jgi:hypothetical protein